MRNSASTVSVLVCVLAIASGCNRDRSDEAAIRPAAATPSVTEPATRPKSDTVATPSLGAIRSALDAGRAESAVAMARAYLLANPGHAEALSLAARGLMTTSRENEAIETLRLIPPEDPEFGLSALGQIADWYLGQGQPRQAEESFRGIIEIHGDVALAHSRLALLMNSQGKRFEAMPHLRALAQMQDITTRELGALVTISQQCAVEQVPGTTGDDKQPVEGDLRRTRQMAAAGKWDESLALMKQLRAQFPESNSIAAFLGTLHVTLQQVEELRNWTNSLPAGTEQQPEYWSTMTRWMAMEGRHEEAIRCACETVARDPTHSAIYLRLAQSLRAVGQQDQAQRADQRAMLLKNTRDVYLQTFLREPTAADYASLGDSMLQLKRPWEALGWLKSAARINPNDAAVVRLNKRLRDYSPRATEEAWILCGVDRNRYRLPDAGDLQLETPLEGTITDTPTLERRIVLVNVADRLGVDFQYDPGNDRTDGSYLLHQTMGGGIGVIDYDRDGWPDLYLSQAGGEAFTAANLPNRLYRNLSGDQFVDRTIHSGSGDLNYGQGVTAADLNQDGFADLIVANIGPNVFYRNNGDGTFSRVELDAWQQRDHWTSLVAAGDLSGDGIPELVECNYIDDPKAMTVRCTLTQQLCAPAEFRPSTDRVLQGKPDGTFAAWSDGGPLEQQASYTLGVIITNTDSLHGNELFLANDTRPNAFWVSRAAETGENAFRLSEEARLRGCDVGPLGELQGCMGIAGGDFDRNGTFDMYVTNYYNEASNLYLQQHAGLFIDSAARFGARTPSTLMVGFGTQATDLDRDGWLDLVVLNGHAVDRRDKGEPLQMPPQLFRGLPGRFEVLEQQDPFWSTPTLGRTLALADFNRDGRPDLVAGHLDKPVALLQNASTTGRWIQLELAGTRSERDAVGSKITIRCGEETYVSWVTAGDGYLCTNEPVVDFGIGDATKVDRVTIAWPSGELQEIVNLDADRRYLLVEGEQEAFEY